MFLTGAAVVFVSAGSKTTATQRVVCALPIADTHRVAALAPGDNACVCGRCQWRIVFNVYTGTEFFTTFSEPYCSCQLTHRDLRLFGGKVDPGIYVVHESGSLGKVQRVNDTKQQLDTYESFPSLTRCIC